MEFYIEFVEHVTIDTLQKLCIRCDREGFMKPAILLALAMFSATSAQAGTYAYNCSKADVSCDGLFSDLVSDKFTKTYSYKNYEIFVYSNTTVLDNGATSIHAFAGVTPKSGNRDFDYSPNRWWSSSIHYDRTLSAYDKIEASREAIRDCIEGMMAVCDDSPSCSIIE